MTLVADKPRYINRAFLSRAIAKAQRLSIINPFCQALHEYIARQTKIFRHVPSGLFLVQCPDGTWQVAVWMSDISDILVALDSMAQKSGQECVNPIPHSGAK